MNAFQDRNYKLSIHSGNNDQKSYQIIKTLKINTKIMNAYRLMLSLVFSSSPFVWGW